MSTDENPTPPCRPGCERCVKALRVLGPVAYNNWRSFGEHDEPEVETGSIAPPPSDWEQAMREAFERSVRADGYNAVIDLDEPRPAFTLASAAGPIPVHADPRLPPGTFELRSGDQVQRASIGAAQTPERIVRVELLMPLYEPLAALTEAVFERTGHHGITRVSLTPEAGLSFGIAPGTSIDVHTPAGRVELYAERGPRRDGTFKIPEDREDEPPSVGDDNYLTKLMHPGDEDRSER